MTEREYVFGASFIVAAVTASLQITGCASLPPAKAYVMDSQQKCLETHVWEQTVVATGRTMAQCASITGWSQERKALDGGAS